jgi:hypothetical protein
VRARRRGWIFGAGLWIAFAAFFSAQSYYYWRSIGHPEPLGQVLPKDLLYVAIWGLFTPLIVRLAGRFPVERRAWAGPIAVHVLAAFTFSVVQRCGYESIVFVSRAKAGEPFPWNTFPQLILGSSDYGMFLYFIVLLITHALSYYDRLQSEEAEAARLKADLVAARLETLQIQLQPHFLFNTMNSIAVLIRTDPAAAGVMVGRLADFLRSTLENRDVRLVPLRQELELLESYLGIESVRFEDRLRIVKDVEPSLLDAAVPFLILQPLAENAIRHGIGSSPGPGEILIRARASGGKLVLEVANSGGDGAASVQGDRRGLGLANTKARLAEIYGANGEVTFTTRPDGGFVASIRIPMESAPSGAVTESVR